jgi:hypothetical protein
MTSINRFDSNVYSEELYSFTEEEYADVMATPAVDDEWPGYSEWSEQVERESAPSTLYIDPKDGKVKQIPEPPSRGRIDGIEI